MRNVCGPQGAPAGGQPRAALILLPGLDGTDVFFRPLVAALPTWIDPRVVCYPQAGGTSYADLLRLVREATSDVPEMYILAASFAGPLAMMVAAAEPQRVRGVIFCASFLRSPQPHLNRVTFVTIAPVVWTVRALRRLPMWVRRRGDALRVAKAETWARASTHGIAARARAILEVDTRDLARRCEQPILCVQFDDDKVVGKAHGEEIERHAPHATMVTLPGNHLGMFTTASALAEAVAHFVLTEGRHGRCIPGQRA